VKASCKLEREINYQNDKTIVLLLLPMDTPLKWVLLS